MSFEATAELRVKILDDDRVLLQHGSTEDVTDFEELRLEQIKDAVESTINELEVSGGGIIEDDDLLDHEVMLESTATQPYPNWSEDDESLDI